MNWIEYGLYQMPDVYPHENPEFQSVEWKKASVIARWTDDFDCAEETQFWYTILDKPFCLDSVKAKRRYEINKGLKNFYVKLIRPLDYCDELYDVYLESLDGYKNPTYVTKDAFLQRINVWDKTEECDLFGVFSRDDERLCGFADVYRRGIYLPISSMKTRVSCEKLNVNFALVYGIVQHYELELSNGAYLCDGARNVLHQTAFQDYLIKYFEFRRAYCRLHIQYRSVMKLVMPFLFLFRKCIKCEKLRAVLRLHAWSRNMPD